MAILLSTFNGAAYLSQQLASFVAQDHSDWVLFWRDDGSSDSTETIMQDFVNRVGPERCVRVTEPVRHLGVLGTFMALLNAVVPYLGPADAVAFADQDDVWLPGKLSRALAAIAGLISSGPVLYCAGQILVDASLRRIGVSAPVSVTPGFPASLTQNIAPGCTVVLNRKAARLVASSKPPSQTWHDWWSYILVSAAGGTVIVDTEPTILYRQHARNAVGVGSRLRRAVAALRVGPHVFMRNFSLHVDSLDRHRDLLSTDARRIVSVLHQAMTGGVRDRFRALLLPGLTRNHWTENVLFRLWFLIG